MSVPFLDLAADHLPLAEPFRAAFDEALASSGFIGGQAVTRFEQSFAKFCGVNHTVGVANGTDALELILRAASIGPGDEVIVPTNTFVATAEAVVAAGATPVFADVDAHTLLITPESADAVLSERTAAIMAVHLYGQTVDMVALSAWADRHGLAVFEDAAQAQGAEDGGRRSGGLGLAAGFSFYPGKNLGALGDAGAVTTNDPDLADRVRCLANHGRAAGHHHHVMVGRNSRLDALQASLMSIKLEHLDDWNEHRRQRWGQYLERLCGVDGVRPVAQRPGATPVHHLAVIECDQRDVVREKLSEVGVDTGIHYPVPCHLHPAFARWAGEEPLPVAEAAAARLLSLPMFPTLTEGQVDEVVDELATVLKELR